MPTNVVPVRLSPTERITEAMRRSLPHLSGQTRNAVESMLKPEATAIIAGTLVVWAGSHFFGIGEIVDAILLGIGTVTLGFAVFDGADELYAFTNAAIDAESESDLDLAGQHFARAVILLGVSTIQTLLLRGQGRNALARGMPRSRPRPNVGPPPRAGNNLRISRPAAIPGSLGGTDAYGVIQISRDQSLTEQRITLFHELVHRYFSPRTGPLRQLRAELNLAAYNRSSLLRYLEEALAEGYGQLKVHGLARAFSAYRFPIASGYVTVSRMASEGIAIGTIVMGATLFNVSIKFGAIPKQ